MTCIVTFETNDPIVGANITGAIKSFGDWAILTSQSWLLDTTAEIRTIMETVQPLLGPGDGLWIFTGSSPWCGEGDPIVEDHAQGYFGEAEDYVPRYPDKA